MELRFPIEFTECPTCGSKRRIAEMVTKEEIEKGNLKPGQRTPIIASRCLIFDPTSLQILVPKKEVLMLSVFLDACADCGTLYCIHIEKGVGVIGTQPPSGEIPPGFGRG